MRYIPADVYKLLAKRIRAERTSKKLSIEKLAEAAGIGTSFLGHIETDDRKPSLVTIARLADALDIPIAELFKDIPANRRGKDYDSIQQFAHLIRGKTPSQKTAIINTLRTLAKSL